MDSNIYKLINKLEKSCSSKLESKIAIKVRSIHPGRFSGEVDAELYIAKITPDFHHPQVEKYLMKVKIFSGRLPSYPGWVELYGILPHLAFNGEMFNYIGSAMEKCILKFFSKQLDAGEKIFVEYYQDEETLKALRLGAPPAATRLGCLLFDVGLTWFKDWYFAEGFREGSQKLQAEKPLNERARAKHHFSIKKELEIFIKKTSRLKDRKYYEQKALSRAWTLLETIGTSENVSTETS